MHWIEQRLLPLAGRLTAQPHLSAIRTGFETLSPLMLLTSGALLISNAPRAFGVTTIAPWQRWLQSQSAALLLLIALILAFVIASRLTTIYQSGAQSQRYATTSPMTVGATALLMLGLTLSPHELIHISSTSSGAHGLFVAMLVALITPEIMLRLGQWQPHFHLPGAVPPSALDFIVTLFPTSVLVVITATLNALSLLLTHQSIQQLIYAWLQLPILWLAQSAIGFGFAILLGNGLFYLGVHQTALGAFLLPAFASNKMMLLTEASNGVDVWHMSAPALQNIQDMIANIGGTGSTLSLIIAILITGHRHASSRDLAKAALIPGLFGTNEMVLFGFPVVMNPLLAIPFILGPTISSVTCILLIKAHLLPNLPFAVPWTTPPFLNTYLASGGQIIAPLFQLLCLVFCTLLYLPFVAVAVRVRD
ncbi:PTS transporter subunit EIIC [Lacticaseibacillus daqingensis]|uniref:PTS transporter subunit EIIC n=1 Tax=Lacticaseibacillus daqingensis TaxID=2486014 RepID=UPI000F7A688A|nr:PTS transporter subunit EIIC [Lacticaseibacillus daqingensis]